MYSGADLDDALLKHTTCGGVRDHHSSEVFLVLHNLMGGGSQLNDCVVEACVSAKSAQ